MVTSDLETVLGLFLPRTERHRTKLLKPKFCDGCAYATDGKVFVRVSAIDRRQVERVPETDEEIELCKRIDQVVVAAENGEKLYDTWDIVPAELTAAAAIATVESSARSSRRLMEYAIELDEFDAEVDEHALVEFEVQNDRSPRSAMYSASRIRKIAEALAVYSTCGKPELHLCVMKSDLMLYLKYGDMTLGLMPKYFNFADDRKRYAIASFDKDEITNLKKCEED